MATFDFAELARPISDADPCGPDLELAEDPDYMQFMARAEGLIPASFFSFDRSTIDFEAELQSIKKLLADTRDLRVFVLLAKLLILNRDLSGFSGCCSAIAALVANLWEQVHPRVEGSDAMIRMAVLQSLDDVPSVVLPLQHAPLVLSRRLGTITYRNYLVATGEAKAREGEDAHALSVIEGALLEGEVRDLTSLRDDLARLQAGLGLIQTTSAQKAGFDQAVSFDKLPPLVEKMLNLAESLVLKRDPKAARSPPALEAANAPSIPAHGGNFPAPVVGGAAAVPAPASTAAPQPIVIASSADAAAALSGAAAYFGRCEPSNPALLLIRQAEQLMGKSFFEVMRILIPEQVEQATIHLGTTQTFQLPLERLSGLGADPVLADEDSDADSNLTDSAAEDEAGDEWPAPVEDEAEEDSAAVEPEPTEADANGDDADVERAAAANGAGGAAADMGPAGTPNGAGHGGLADPRFTAKSRFEAMALLHYVGDYYRSVEPSSPIPLLTDRALALAERDFLALLKDVLPTMFAAPEES